MKINLETELKREVEKIKKLGFPISDNIKICTEKLSNCYGYARGFDYIAPNDDFVNVADLKEIRAVIAHEACHCITSSNGHDAIWFEAVSTLAKNYKDDYSNIDIHLAKPYSKERQKAFMEKFPLSEHFNQMVKSSKYVIVCSKCGNVLSLRKKSSKTFDLIKFGLCTCKFCGSSNIEIIQNF